MSLKVQIKSNSITLSDGVNFECLKVADITKIIVKTTGSGPIQNDLYFVFYTPESTLTLPQNIEGLEQDLLFEFFSHFNNFNFEVFIDAMSSTQDQEFICWESN